MTMRSAPTFVAVSANATDTGALVWGKLTMSGVRPCHSSILAASLAFCGPPVSCTVARTTRAARLAYSPQTKYFYLAASPAWPFWLHRFEDPKFFSASGTSVPGIKTTGLIAAIDSRTDKIAWQKPMPYEIQNGSGMMATAGGLLFHGEPDGSVQSYDAKTGSFLPPGPCKSSGTPSSLLATTLLAGDLDGDGKMDLLAFDSPVGYSAAFNTSAAGSPAYTWAPHRILPGA